MDGREAPGSPSAEVETEKVSGSSGPDSDDEAGASGQTENKQLTLGSSRGGKVPGQAPPGKHTDSWLRAPFIEIQHSTKAG